MRDKFVPMRRKKKKKEGYSMIASIHNFRTKAEITDEKGRCEMATASRRRKICCFSFEETLRFLRRLLEKRLSTWHRVILGTRVGTTSARGNRQIGRVGEVHDLCPRFSRRRCRNEIVEAFFARHTRILFVLVPRFVSRNIGVVFFSLKTDPDLYQTLENRQ